MQISRNCDFFWRISLYKEQLRIAKYRNGYGPKIVKRKGTKLKRNFKVALSGAYTTNAMIFKMRYKDAKIIYKNFLDIENAVICGEVDAGVLIHESILNFSDELEVEAHLWDIWAEMSRENLPLPLGGMAILRSIPLLRAIECQKLLTDAVRVAVNNKRVLSAMLRGRVRVNESELETYLNMYANGESIAMSEVQMKALDKLFALGFNAGIYGDLIRTEDYLVPSEYEKLRFG